MQTNDTRIVALVSVELRERVAAAAKAADRSLGAEVRRVLSREYAAAPTARQ